MNEATHLSDFWGDRRIRQNVLNGPERRSGLDRRSQLTEVTFDNRNRSTTRNRWRSGRLERITLILGDIFSLTLSFVAAWALTIGNDPTSVSGNLFGSWDGQWDGQGEIWIFLHLLLAGSIVTTFWITGQYAKRIPFWDELARILKALTIAACLNAAIIFFLHVPFSRMWLLGTWGMAFVLLPLTRVVVKRTLINMGGWMRPTVIIGTGRNASDAALALRSDPLLGFQLMAFMVPPSSWGSTEEEASASKVIDVNGSRFPVYRMHDEPGELLRHLGKPHIVVALDGNNDTCKISELLNKSRGSYSTLNIVPSMRGLPLVGTEVMHFFRHEVLLLQIQNNLARKMPQRIKRFFDIVVSTLSLIALAPLFVLVSVGIARYGSSPFFGHRRVGQDGKPFTCYKFQSMYPNANEVLQELLRDNPEARREWEQNFKIKDDPRVTRIGAFLRRTSLDELPQLWNVLKGEMSLVGPRPVVEAELERYGDHMSYYLEAKPGITGVWQISGRSDISYSERVALDVWYAKNWTLWYDIVILVKTVREVIFSKGAY
ncbi:MAG: undecaprenyl-phosphate galactose phosphotransferase WbaP [Thiogranum sp.]